MGLNYLIKLQVLQNIKKTLGTSRKDVLEHADIRLNK